MPKLSRIPVQTHSYHEVGLACTQRARFFRQKEDIIPIDNFVYLNNDWPLVVGWYMFSGFSLSFRRFKKRRNDMGTNILQNVLKFIWRIRKLHSLE